MRPASGPRADGILTDDLFLGGLVRVLQPVAGYRAGLDAVLLAAALAARPGEQLFEPGAGVGTASLCAAARLPGITVTGLEIDPRYHALAQTNAARNGLSDRAVFHHGDIADPPPVLRDRSFDQVFVNPPYRDPREGTRARTAGRAGALSGRDGGPGLEDWLGLSLRRLKPKGRFTVIHQADKLDRILAALNGSVGMLTIVPLWPMAGRPAKRVIVTGRKGVRGPVTLAPGLILHAPDGGPTPAHAAIARHGHGLDWTKTGGA